MGYYNPEFSVKEKKKTIITFLTLQTHIKHFPLNYLQKKREVSGITDLSAIRSKLFTRPSSYKKRIVMIVMTNSCSCSHANMTQKTVLHI